MSNQVVIVGRLVENPIVEENQNGKKVCIITLAVPRSFKNDEGIYDTDFIKCVLWNSIAENIVEYCGRGDLIGVKGRLECLCGSELQVVAEKVTFLPSKKVENE